MAKGWQAAFNKGLKSKPLVYPQVFDLDNYQTQPQPFAEIMIGISIKTVKGKQKTRTAIQTVLQSVRH